MAAEGSGPSVTVVLPAEIDITNYDKAGAGLVDAISQHAFVIADMTGTTFCDSSGLRMLMITSDKALARGVTLRFVITAGTPLERALAISGFDQILPLHYDLAEARSAY